MISLTTIGPTLGYALGRPVPRRNCSTVSGKSWPNDRALIATKCPSPTLVTYRPNDTLFSPAPKLACARYPERAPFDDACPR